VDRAHRRAHIEERQLALVRRETVEVVEAVRPGEMRVRRDHRDEHVVGDDGMENVRAKPRHEPLRLLDTFDRQERVIDTTPEHRGQARRCPHVVE
jgi:hypothetical protein